MANLGDMSNMASGARGLGLGLGVEVVARSAYCGQAGF